MRVLEILKIGPAYGTDLAKRLGIPIENLFSSTKTILARGLIVKRQHKGRTLYELAELPPRAAEGPIRRMVTARAEQPSAEALAAANWFGKAPAITRANDEQLANGPASSDPPDTPKLEQPVSSTTDELVAPRFRYALFNDGELLIRIDGHEVMLSVIEARNLSDYLERTIL